MLILKAFGQDILTDALSKIFGKILRTIFLAFDSIIYALISYLYKIFTFLSQVRLFENARMKDLSDRMYIIIGVIALFLVAYALISAIINPDNATKGKNSSFSGIVKNIIFAIIGIAIVPTIFDYAYEFQERVLCKNVISNFFAVSPGTKDEGTDFSSEMSVKLFQSFFYAKTTNENDDSNQDAAYNNIFSDDGVSLAAAFNSVENDEKSLFAALGNFDKAFDDDELGYLYLVSTIAGLYCAYVLLGFVIDIAIRAVKLSYLQIIAPLPIMTLVIPNQKKVFDNWLKKTTSCFMEVFVRVIAITFAAYAVRYLPEYVFGNEMQTCGEGITGVVSLLTRAAFILGIFGFLKQAPKLISELIPGFDSKGFKLGFKESFAEVGGFRALGAAGGFASSAAKNAAISGSRAYRNTNGPFKQQNKLAKFANGALAVAAGGAAGVAGAVAGGAKGGYKGFVGAKEAKKWSDSRSAADKAAEEVIEERFAKEDKEQANAKAHEDWGIQDYVKDAFGNFVSSSRANYLREKAKQEEISKITAAEKAIDDKYASIVEKNKDRLIYDGKTISAWEQQEETAKNYLAGLAKQKAELIASNAPKGHIKKLDDEIYKAQNDVITARSNATKASRELKKQMHKDPDNIITNELDDSGNAKKFTFKQEDSSIIDQLYVDYNSMLKSHIDALSGNDELYKRAQSILNDVSSQKDEKTQKDRFRQLIENQSDTINGEDKEYNFIDNVKIEAAKVTEKMNKEGEAARKQQENKK